jgi:hypothetical protein
LIYCLTSPNTRDTDDLFTPNNDKEGYCSRRGVFETDFRYHANITFQRQQKLNELLGRFFLDSKKFKLSTDKVNIQFRMFSCDLYCAEKKNHLCLIYEFTGL